MKVLETERLIVRHLQADDLDDFYAICGDSEIMRYVGNNEPLSKEQTQQWIKKSQDNYQKHGFGCFAVVSKSDKQFIGYCGLVYGLDGNPGPEIIYALKKAYWGQGLATEAATAMLNFGFQQCHLPRIEATVDPKNLASIKIIEKLGMTYQRAGLDEHNLPTLFYALENPAHLRRLL